MAAPVLGVRRGEAAVLGNGVVAATAVCRKCLWCGWWLCAGMPVRPRQHSPHQCRLPQAGHTGETRPAPHTDLGSGAGCPGNQAAHPNTPPPHHPTAPRHCRQLHSPPQVKSVGKVECGCVLVGWTPGLSTGVRWDQQVGLRSQRAPPPATAPQCID